MFASRLKEKLRRHELTIGGLMTLNFWAGFAEIYKKAGMDYLMVDIEHGSCTLPQLEDICRVARLVDLPVLVRPEGSVYHVLRRYMDMGTTGFIMPWIERQEQIKTLHDAVFTPPRGRRGPGGPSVLGVANINRAGWDEFERNFCVILMVETVEGIEAIKDFVTLDWVDAVMVGPYDLSLNMDRCNQMYGPEVVSAIDRIIAHVRAAGKPVGMPVGTVEQARFWQERGCNLLLYSETTAMVQRTSEQFVREMRGAG